MNRIEQKDKSEKEQVFEFSDEEVRTVNSGEEDLNDHFKISEGVVNKYRTQVRIMKTKERTVERLFGKYFILYVDESNLSKES